MPDTTHRPDKRYITPSELLQDAYALAFQVYHSGYRPDYIIGVWRGGTPVAIALHELLWIMGIHADHMAVRARSYSGIGKRNSTIELDGMEWLLQRAQPDQSVLVVDDVHDTGVTLQYIVETLGQQCQQGAPQVRVATPWYKPHNNQTPSAPDYYLHSTAQWLVFPHELQGLTREELAAGKPELANFIDQLPQTLP